MVIFAHLPRRMSECLLEPDVGKFNAGEPAERAAACRQHDSGQFAAGIDPGTQTLLHRAVLAVDRHEFGAGSRPQRLDHRSTGDQALLVGQSQPFALLQGPHRHGETGETDDSIDDHVGVVYKIGQVGDHFGERQRVGDLGPAGRIGHCDDLRTELVGLSDQDLDRRADTEADDLVATGFGTDDVEGLLPGRP